MKLIVGIDPGLNTGIACVGIEDDFSTMHTMRNASMSDVCGYIISQGEPLIMATDVKRVPQTVKRLSAAFNARLFFRQLTVSQKKKLARKKDYNNMHERDAMAAAIAARKFFTPIFSRVDNVLERRGLSVISAQVKEMLIKRQAENIKAAIRTSILMERTVLA